MLYNVTVDIEVIALYIHVALHCKHTQQIPSISLSLSYMTAYVGSIGLPASGWLIPVGR